MERKQLQSFIHFNILLFSFQLTSRPFTVRAINDYVPEIQGSVLTISEGSAIGSLVGVVNVIDQDSGPAGLLSFASISHPSFNATVNKTSNQVEIYTTAELDRETKAFYVVMLTVKDDAPRPFEYTQQATLNITVSDINDNCPIYEYDRSVYLVREDTVGHFLRHKLIDADMESNLFVINASSNSSDKIQVNLTGLWLGKFFLFSLTHKSFSCMKVHRKYYINRERLNYRS